MPRKTRNSKKKAPLAPSESSRRKLATIAEGAEEDTMESFLEDFRIQTEALKKQARKQFESQAKKLLIALPEKSSIPKEILKMTVAEFIARGGTFLAVRESLIKERMDEAGTMLPQKPPLSELKDRGNKENECSKKDPQSTPAMDPNFITPAVGSRSQAVTRPQYTGNITKRKPQALESIHVTACSTTGSPVDETEFMKLRDEYQLGFITAHMMEEIELLPQRHRSRLMKKLKTLKVDTLQQGSEFVTPAVRR